MFSVPKNRELYRTQLDAHRKRLITMSPRERAKLEKYLNLIQHFNANDTKQVQEDLKTLEPFTPEEVYKFSENNTIFRQFCVRETSPWNEPWSQTLKKLGYVGANITSLDGKPHSIFDQIRGAFLFSQFTNATDTASGLMSLDLACRLGLFQALVKRCEINQDRITTLSNEVDKTFSLGEIYADVKQLGNIYGVVGYLQASLILLDIGNYYANQNEDGLAALAMTFQTAAVESFFCAEVLAEEKRPDDDNIIKAICGDQGLALFGFLKWKDGENYMLGHIDDEITPHDTLRTEAKNKINTLIKEKQEHKK